MPKRRLYVWKTKRKPQRYEHNLLIPRPRARRKPKEKKRESLPFERPSEDYTDAVCLLVGDREVAGHMPAEVLIDADRLDDAAHYEWVIWMTDKTTHPYIFCFQPDPRFGDWIISLHKFLMGPPKGLVVDHRDHNVWNNRSLNLRVCTRQQNSWNTKAPKNKKSRFKGVTQTCSGKNPKWRASIRGLVIGTFREEDFAAYGYNVIARKHFGEFAFENEVSLRDEEIVDVMETIADVERRREHRKYWADQPKVQRKREYWAPQSAHALAAIPETPLPETE